jgi:hypothetical protein
MSLTIPVRPERDPGYRISVKFSFYVAGLSDPRHLPHPAATMFDWTSPPHAETLEHEPDPVPAVPLPPEVPLAPDGPFEPGPQAPETPGTIVRTADRTLIVLGCREPDRLVTKKQGKAPAPARDPQGKLKEFKVHAHARDPGSAVTLRGAVARGVRQLGRKR